MAEEHELKQLDRRIQEAQTVEDMTKSKGWSLLSKRLDELRNEAHYHTLMIGNKLWRGKLIMIDQVIGLPEEFFQDREKAQEEKEAERELKGV